MSREEAQREVLLFIEERIAVEGENAIAFMAPQPGKNSWTWKEVRESTINDTPLEGIKEGNFIDDMLSMYKWKQEHIKVEEKL